MHSCGGGDCIAVWLGGREVNGGDWGVLLDEDGMLELSPVARVCAVPRGRWPSVFLDEDGLVVHRAREQRKPTFCGEGGPGHVCRRSISRWIKTFESASRSPPSSSPLHPLHLISALSTHPLSTMLLYSDVLTDDEMFSDAFPMYVPRSHPNLCSISLFFFSFYLTFAASSSTTSSTR